MVETEWLFQEIRKRFGDKPLRAEVWEWLVCNQWEVLKHMFPGCGEILQSVSDDTYDNIIDDLVRGEYDEALAQRLIDLEFDLQEDE